MKKIILMCLLLLGAGSAFADGGFTTYSCYVNVACPSGQTGYITYNVRASSNVINGCKDTKGINNIINRGNAKITANTCVSASSYSYTNYENSTSACPATQPNGVINIQRSYEVWTDGSIRNYSAWYETSRSCSASISYYGYNNSTSACPATQPSGVINVQQRYEVWTDGSVRNYTAWYETSRTCAATLSYRGYNNSTSNCPATQPSGVINIQQSYEVWTDGSIRNYSAWYETSRTCIAVYQSTETAYQSLSCSANGGPYTEGGNGISQSRARQIWSDGAKDWSVWTTTLNTCYRTVADTQAQKTYACAEGQKGKIVKEPRRTHIEYAADASKTQDEKNALQEKTATTWAEYVINNTCTNIPDSTWSEKSSRNVTCESVKGSGYSGTATQTGTYYYTYSSATKITTSYFDVESTDASACYNTNSVSDVKMETITETCPNGQTGEITKYRYAKTDSNNKVTYTDYQLLNNSCASTVSSSDDLITDLSTDEAFGILSNSTLKASDANAVKNFSNFINTVKVKDINSDSYNLNIIIDDFSNYNVTNVSNAINLYKSKLESSGNNPKIKIFLPKELSKYSEMKNKKYNNYVFQDAVLGRDGNAIVTYKIVGDTIAINNTTKTFKTKILLNVSNISNIQTN